MNKLSEKYFIEILSIAFMHTNAYTEMKIQSRTTSRSSRSLIFHNNYSKLLSSKISLILLKNKPFKWCKTKVRNKYHFNDL